MKGHWMVSGVAIVAGAALVPLLGRLVQARAVPFAVHAGASLLLWVCGQAGSLPLLFVAYFGFIFMFEVAFTAAQAGLIQACRPEDIATLSAGSNALGTGLLIICSLSSGWLSDHLPMPTVALLVAGIGMLWAIGVEWGRVVMAAGPRSAAAEPGGLP